MRYRVTVCGECSRYLPMEVEDQSAALHMCVSVLRQCLMQGMGERGNTESSRWIDRRGRGKKAELGGLQMRSPLCCLGIL